MTAACVRAQRDRAGLLPPSSSPTRSAVRHGCGPSSGSISFGINCDDSDRTLARGVLNDRYTWLEEGILDPSIEGPWIAQEGGVGKSDVHRSIR